VVVCDENDAREAGAWDLSPAQEGLPTRRLLRCKAELAALITIDDEVHPSIAKITHAIEQDHRTIWQSPWRFLALLLIIPRPVRDAAYRWFAKHRYRWFGRSETCRVPTPDVSGRFIT
jgi:predicted DCC family thiol-disulfide oxidoreductase YuxK